MNSNTADSSQIGSRPSRLYHKKSRNGCQRCKARRVKCDEERPTCGNCTRHMVPCVYNVPVPTTASRSGVSRSSNQQSADSSHSQDQRTENQPTSTSPAALISHGASPHTTSPEAVTENDIYSVPESRSRRLLELRLLHNYMDNVKQPFAVTESDKQAATWDSLVPYMSFDNDNLLYSMLAVSASHLLRKEPNNHELVTARQNYMGLALREQRSAVAHLDKRNADAVCFCSSLILVLAFAMLHERIVEPYCPPMDWLRMGRGAGTVFEILYDNMDGADAAKFMLLVRGPPVLDDDDELFGERNRAPFLHLLRDADKFDMDAEMWSAKIREAYEITLSYMGSIHRAIMNDESMASVCRRLMAFPIRIPKLFIDLVEERRPRALVILAYYFALTNHVRQMWWLGDTPQKEIQAVYDVVPKEWKRHMQWPFEAIGLNFP